MLLQTRLESEFGLAFKKKPQIHFLLALERWIEYREYICKPLTKERLQSLVACWESSSFEFKRAVAYSLNTGKAELCRNPEDECKHLRDEIARLKRAA